MVQVKRLLQGGHHVPSQDVRRRFTRSICNFFKLYQPLLDSWMLFDNAGSTPRLIAKTTEGHILISNQELFEKIKSLVR